MVDENANIEFQVEPTINTKDLAEQFGCSFTNSLLLNTKSIKKAPKAINSIDTLLVKSLQLNKADIEIDNTDSDLYCGSLTSRLKELPKKKNHLARIRRSFI